MPQVHTPLVVIYFGGPLERGPFLKSCRCMCLCFDRRIAEGNAVNTIATLAPSIVRGGARIVV